MFATSVIMAVGNERNPGRAHHPEKLQIIVHMFLLFHSVLCSHLQVMA